MPFASMKLVPGLNVERTDSLNEAGYTATEHGRFKDGLFQKLGGWARLRPVNFEYGITALTAYQDLVNVKYLVLGSSAALHVVTDSTDFIITPQRKHTFPAYSFDTTVGSDIVTVTDTGVTTIEPFDAVVFYTPVSVGGIILSGLYQINSYVAAHKFTVKATMKATAAVTGGGAGPVFATTAGSAIVDITFNDHGRIVGDVVALDQNTTAVGGLQFWGIFKVFSVTSANVFSVVFNQAAASNDSQPMGGATADLYYYLAIGPIAAAQAYGTGNYGDGAYGSGISPTIQTGTAIAPYDYSLCSWGNVLIAAPRVRPLAYWDYASGFSTVQPIGNGPLYNEGAFISQSSQILMVYGATVDLRVGNVGIGEYQDLLLIQWSDQEDFLTWTPTDTNFAGSYKLPSGTQLISGLSTPTRDLFWTDIELWGATFTGYPYTFSFSKLGVNCGIIGKRACCTQANVVYWMGATNFFVFDGSQVRPLPCPVWDIVFQNLHPTYKDNSFAFSNALFNEIWFFYVSTESSFYPDKYVKYNTLEGTWDSGVMSRSCGMDQSVWGNPILVAPENGVIYSHEIGKDNDTSPLSSSFETGYFTISDSQEIVFIDRIIPDFKYGPYSSPSGANINITIYAQNHPNDTPRVYGPYACSTAIPEISCRIRGRLLKMRVESSDLGSFWRLGRVRFRYAPDGRR
jgi:hypothetical protein